MGYSVSSAGDVNNDGYDDVIFGGHGVTEGAFILHGDTDGDRNIRDVDTDTRIASYDPIEFGRIKILFDFKFSVLIDFNSPIDSGSRFSLL